MCYINGIRVSLDTFLRYKQQQKELKELQSKMQLRRVMKGFEYADWPVIKPIYDANGFQDWEVVPMEWGFLPSYLQTAEQVQRFRFGYKDSSGKFNTPITTLNAMGEEMLLPKKMYRDAALHRRCIVLSSGFYEHQHIFPKNKRTGEPLKTANKFPYHITVKDKPVFMIAGIYQPWINKETGEVKDTFALCTTEANSLMKQVHNSKERMPTILTDELADEWTEPNLTEERITQIATNIYPSNLMQAHTIAKNFLELEEPNENVVYPEVPELVYE